MSTRPSLDTLMQEVADLREQLAAEQAVTTSLKSTQKRQESEQERFYSVMQALPEGVYIVNQSYDIEYINPVLKKEFGPVSGRKCYQYLHDRTTPCLDCKNREVFAGKSIRREWRSKTNNKHYIIFDSPLKNTEGELEKLAIFHDTTPVRQITEELKESRTLLNGIINNSTAVICVKDTQGRYLMANTRFIDLFNQSDQDIIGKNDIDFFPKDQAEVLQANDRKVLQDKQTRQFEETLQQKDGSHVYISIKFPLVRTDGSVYAVAAISTDITDRKQQELDLQENNDWLTTLINASPDIICFKDGEGRWLQANEADLRLFQLTGVDYRGKTDAQLAQYSAFYEEAFLGCMESDEITLLKGELTEGEERIPRPDGQDAIYKIIKVPLFHPEGTRKGLVVLGHEITARRRREQRLHLEIAARKQATEMIREKKKELEETNIALRVLLTQQKKVGVDVQQSILSQLEKSVFPYLQLLRQCLPDEQTTEYLDIISRHLRSVGESFTKKLSNPDLGLTKREILVADLVRQGKSTKEIAKLLGLQPRSVEAYRNKIRKKLHLNNKNITLKQYLSSTFTSED